MTYPCGSSNIQRSDVVYLLLLVIWIHFDVALPLRPVYLYSRNGTISSPNYPRPYPTDQEYLWKIAAPVEERIKLYVVDFDLGSTERPHSHCEENDFVEIYDKKIAVYCSSRPAVKGAGMISEVNFFEVYFSSDSEFDSGSRGFVFRYEMIPKAPLTTRMLPDTTSAALTTSTNRGPYRGSKTDSQSRSPGLPGQAIAAIIGCSVVATIFFLGMLTWCIKIKKTRRAPRSATSPNMDTYDARDPNDHALPGYTADMLTVDCLPNQPSVLVHDVPPPSYEEALDQSTPVSSTLQVNSGGAWSSTQSVIDEGERPPSYAEATSMEGLDNVGIEST